MPPTLLSSSFSQTRPVLWSVIVPSPLSVYAKVEPASVSPS
jgi:hypothetical protein